LHGHSLHRLQTDELSATSRPRDIALSTGHLCVLRHSTYIVICLTGPLFTLFACICICAACKQRFSTPAAYRVIPHRQFWIDQSFAVFFCLRCIHRLAVIAEHRPLRPPSLNHTPLQQGTASAVYKYLQQHKQSRGKKALASSLGTLFCSKHVCCRIRSRVIRARRCQEEIDSSQHTEITELPLFATIGTPQPQRLQRIALSPTGSSAGHKGKSFLAKLRRPLTSRLSRYQKFTIHATLTFLPDRKSPSSTPFTAAWLARLVISYRATCVSPATSTDAISDVFVGDAAPFRTRKVKTCPAQRQTASPFKPHSSAFSPPFGRGLASRRRIL
jgi:hypothetical protein